ncbi:YybH family protein [Pseudomonas mangrovi]|mgnify:CR=1 FL=1|uniref:DUF4440 domain-containing protein n=1 Tax=Pseudomonas mangrovi TaxID=2161748 RepID=A0A2T5P6T5_9PSED|nr:nuclear transport factor 2 family protein [Pseudomonas mangrovi]PTU73450.1 DUF4440 domain-containing protein [Pseudomonas mangrovi]
MKTQVNDSAAEQELRQLISTWSQAVKRQDIEQILAIYAKEVVAFDAIGQLQFKGLDSYAAHWRACMEHCPGEGVFELHEVAVQAQGDLGFAHWLVRCGPPSTDGSEPQVCWMRASACYRRGAEGWRVVHEHWSAPCDMETGKTLFDLQP